MRSWLKQFFGASKTPSAPQSASPSALAASVEHKQQGDALLRDGAFAAAAQAYRRALESDPHYALAHCNLGFVLKEQGLVEAAELSLERALALDPAIADAHYMLATLCQADGRLEAACAHLRKALELAPDFEMAYLELVKLLFQRDLLEDAVKIAGEGIRHNPACANLHLFLGNLQDALNQPDLACASYETALSIQPAYPQALANLGTVLLRQEKLDAAIAALRQAVALEPQYLDAYTNLGNALLKQNRFDEAMACYDKGLAIDRRSGQLHYNKGLLSLLLGDFASGWQDYEYRWTQTDQFCAPDFAQPLWLDDADIAGKAILLHAEQGLGDTLHFVRYVERVAAQGATVYLQVHPQLVSLVASMPGVTQVLASGEPLPAFDYHCPLASLPLAFKTDLATIPSNTPYLRAPAERADYWAQRLQGYAAPRIGLVWAGAALFRNDRNRSIPLPTFARITENRHLHFFSLQKDLRAADAPLLQTLANVTQLGPELSDFAETAAVIGNLDLVITVDTSVAHLAGALGKPVWILLPFFPDFRWLLERTDSPWYPSARLFRQVTIGDWDSVATAVQEALSAQFPELTASRIER